jgi:ribosomal protein L4
LKIELPDQGYKYLTENSQECDAQTAFVLTNQNAKYLEDAGINVFDLLKHEYLLISKESVEKIEKRLSGN